MKKSIKRRKRKPLTPEQIDRLIGRLRIGELNKLFAYRYGGDRITYEFPDDDAGREDLVILLQHYGFTNPHKMAGIIKLRAPWMEVDEVVRTLERVNTYCRRWRAETLGRELRVTKGEWQRLGLRTIAPCDMTREERKQERKMRDRLRKGLKRRTQGRKPRADYLAASKSRTKPWETAGISRRTWYRQQTKLNGTGVSPIILPKAADRPVPQGKPLCRKEVGRASAGLLARARLPNQSKLRARGDAPANADADACNARLVPAKGAQPPAHAPIGHNAGPPLEPEKPRQPIPGLRPAMDTNGHANLTADAVDRRFREYKLKLEVERVLGRKIQ